MTLTSPGFYNPGFGYTGATYKKQELTEFELRFINEETGSVFWQAK
ncbi:MAG: hypothetical protein VYB44_01305 [Bacteroidota bacterium]|nr:hypothetical protein [Bacteroidota bacterium]